MKSVPTSKKRLPSIKTMRNKCDKLLTPIIKERYPNCLLCGKYTEVAHHFCHKSKSTRLRYELSNLINLCNSCHYKLHQNESYWASRIVEIKGLKWFQEIDKIKNEIVKSDVHYFISQYEKLKALNN